MRRQVHAYYEASQNALVIPTAIKSRLIFFNEGPPALNYGVLGTIVSNKMMHAYDVTRIAQDEVAETRPWASGLFTREYYQRALCLRPSHGAAIPHKARQKLDNLIDSENRDDLVDVKIAYRVFYSLPYHDRRLKMGGLNISTERLFFIGHCLKWCSKESDVVHQQAPFHFRCVVPLMNMPEFSNASDCAVGQPMSPQEKCNIWS
ncbi:hypothetical protein HPB51_010702 [Rhipicephalus microplus]|uniref:Peptidase M13 C-terminal domain-containing protein n=1 Tax=Rhipicephalus microplus TaxID=6941 RepID=A0A9J6F1N3_RHIMP|nr:hypothetical protein HPB51_010702 [Rhipicephalus microplus]